MDYGSKMDKSRTDKGVLGHEGDRKYRYSLIDLLKFDMNRAGIGAPPGYHAKDSSGNSKGIIEKVFFQGIVEEIKYFRMKKYGVQKTDPYAHPRGFDPASWENMDIQYVEKGSHSRVYNQLPEPIEHCINITIKPIEEKTINRIFITNNFSSIFESITSDDPDAEIWVQDVGTKDIEIQRGVWGHPQDPLARDVRSYSDDVNILIDNSTKREDTVKASRMNHSHHMFKTLFKRLI